MHAGRPDREGASAAGYGLWAAGARAYLDVADPVADGSGEAVA